MPLPHIDEPIERVSAVDLVVRAITRLALSGRLRPGSPLREVELSERFDVGRHTVRAALQALANNGVAIHRPDRGVFVRSFTTQDIEYIYELRQVLEAEAVRTHRERNLSRSTVDEALNRLKILGSTYELDEAVAADLQVHRALVQGLENPRMLQVYDSLMLELRLALAQAEAEFDDPMQMYREHRELIDRIWTLPPLEAADYIRGVVFDSMNDVISAMGLRQPAAR